MSHNRVHANKNTYDSRSQSNPSDKYMEALKMGKARPAWRWQGRGRYEYTSSPEAARYVALCRQREIDKLHATELRKVVPTIAQMLARGVDARLGAVAA